VRCNWGREIKVFAKGFGIGSGMNGAVLFVFTLENVVVLV
jgi:hypothetical protein